MQNRRYIGPLSFCSLLAVAALDLAACSSTPEPNFYILSQYQLDRAAPPSTIMAPSYTVAVGPVSIPQSVDRPQLVIRVSDNRVEIKEQQRWAGSLKEDIAQVVADDLGRALPTATVYNQLLSKSSPVTPDYRLVLDVQRFESVLHVDGISNGALIDVAWTLHALQKEKTLSCRTSVQLSLFGGSYDALITAHRKALHQLSQAIASVLGPFVAGKKESIPAGTVCQGNIDRG